MKQDIALKSWVEQKTNEMSRTNFLGNHLIPDVDLALENFDEYIQKSKAILSERLKKALSIKLNS